MDGNWIGDVEGQVEILWDEGFTDWSIGTLEFRHLRYDATLPSGSPGVREWFAEASLHDPRGEPMVAPTKGECDGRVSYCERLRRASFNKEGRGR